MSSVSKDLRFVSVDPIGDGESALIVFWPSPFPFAFDSLSVAGTTYSVERGFQIAAAGEHAPDFVVGCCLATSRGGSAADPDAADLGRTADRFCAAIASATVAPGLRNALRYSYVIGILDLCPTASVDDDRYRDMRDFISRASHDYGDQILTRLIGRTAVHMMVERTVPLFAVHFGSDLSQMFVRKLSRRAEGNIVAVSYVVPDLDPARPLDVHLIWSDKSASLRLAEGP